MNDSVPQKQQLGIMLIALNVLSAFQKLREKDIGQHVKGEEEKQ